MHLDIVGTLYSHRESEKYDDNCGDRKMNFDAQKVRLVVYQEMNAESDKT